MKYLIGLLITIVVIIFIIIKLLTGSSGNAPLKATDLTSYAQTETIMRMTTNNDVQASVNHREIQIDIGQNEATLTIYRGYEGEVVTSKSFPMNVTAYTDFLAGLKNSANYTKGTVSSVLGDGSGVCATGDRFNYQIVDPDGKLTQNFWSSTCGSGTYKGLTGITQQLFKLQIPDYDTLTQNVEL